jgi:predicted MFS family arabinose efflux permease
MKANILILFVIIIAWGSAHSAAFVMTQLRILREGKNSTTVAMALNIASCNFGIATGAALGAWSFEGFLFVGAGFYIVVLTQQKISVALQQD